MQPTIKVVFELVVTSRFLRVNVIKQSRIGHPQAQLSMAAMGQIPDCDVYFRRTTARGRFTTSDKGQKMKLTGDWYGEYALKYGRKT